MVPPLLLELTLVFLVAIPVAYVCKRLEIPVIIGLLLSGVLTGPTGLQLISDPHQVEAVAEIGVVLLLFGIGLELSGGELARLRKPVLLGGGVQVLTTILLVEALGGVLGLPWEKALFFGFLVSLSSTAIVLKTLQDRAETALPHGRTSLSILIFQDIIVIPMMLVTPLLAGGQGSVGQAMLLMAAKAATLVVVVFVVAKKLLPRVFHALAATRSREMFFLSVLALCLGVALLSGKLGLSLSLGAFLAGLILAESDYGLRSLEGLLPFKDVFTSIFFLSVGMLLDMHFFFANITTICGLALAFFALKVGCGWLAGLAIGLPQVAAITAGLCLAQIGEFSFILARTGIAQGLMTRQEEQLFLASGVLSMIGAPFLIAAAPGVSRAFAGAWNRLLRRPADFATPTHGEDNPACGKHLVIAGFGIGGRNLAKAASLFEIPFSVIDLNPDTVREQKTQGVDILYGDASESLVLKRANIGCAKVLAVLLPDPASARRVVELAKRLNPAVEVVVRTRFVAEIDDLYGLGADEVIAEEFETAAELFTRALTRLLVPYQRIEEIAERMRADHYLAFRAGASTSPGRFGSILRELPGLDFTVVTLEAGAPMDGVTLVESGLRHDHGLTVAAVVRNKEVIANPAAEFRLAAGDTVYLFGESCECLEKRALFLNPKARSAREDKGAGGTGPSSSTPVP